MLTKKVATGIFFQLPVGKTSAIISGPNNKLYPEHVTPCKDTHLTPFIMKNKALPFLLILLVTALSGAISIADVAFSVEVGGSENKDVLKDGLKPSELTQLTVNANEEGVNIEEFQIILARDKSPILAEKVMSNTFDLTRFKPKAKPGDRIAIEVTKISSGSESDLAQNNRVLFIPIR
jgi:hypothetical protein